VTAIAASYIQERQALLRASIVSNADAAVVFFEWGTTTGYGSQTPLRNGGDGYRSVSLGEVLTGLACNTTYHYRAVASNANGTTHGPDGTFTTASCSPTPVVTVTATDPTATENPMTTGTFLIERTGSTVAELPVTYSVGGTATVGVDHTLGAGTVVIPAGSTSRTLTLFPLDDTLVESDETVVVTIQPQSQYTVGTPSSATVTITSDDVAGGDLIFSDGFESGNLCGWSFVSGGVSQCSRSTSFAPKVDLQTGTEPLGLMVTDLDGDGRRDIAVTIYNNGSGDHLTIFRNTGTVGHPQFDAPVDIPTGRGPEGMAAGDLNNDGKPDLVAANPGDSTISVLRNSSTPGLMQFDSVPLSLSAPPTPHRIAIADFDGDGKPDLIVTSNSGRLVSVFHHATDPNTIAFDYRRDFGATGFLNDLAVADIDRDTRPEILIPITDTGLLTILQNNSSPGNVQASALAPLAAGAAPIRGIAVGDLNNDHAADVVVAAIGGVGVFQNSSSPGVFNLSRTDLPTGTNPDAVAIGDLDKDGLSDVVVANPSDRTLTVLRNASTGNTIVLTPLALRPITGLTPISLVLGDVDGDGWLDIVVANHDGNSISIFLNTTSGPPQPPSAWMETAGPDLTNSTATAGLVTTTLGEVFASTNRSCQDSNALGVFRSTDQGASWTQLNLGLTSTNVGSLALSKGGNLFAGAHDGIYRYDRTLATWKPSGLSGQTIIMLVATQNGLFAADSCYCRGLYQSFDEGSTWQPTAGGLPTCVNAFVQDASGNSFAGTGTSGVFKLPAGGTSWQAVNGGLPTSDVHWLALDAGGNLFMGGPAGLFRMNQGAVQWQQLTSGLPSDGVQRIAFGAGGKVFVGTFSHGIYVSNDGGNTWSVDNSGIADTTPTVGAFAIDNQGYIYSAVGSIVYRSTGPQ